MLKSALQLKRQRHQGVLKVHFDTRLAKTYYGLSLEATHTRPGYDNSRARSKDMYEKANNPVLQIISIRGEHQERAIIETSFRLPTAVQLSTEFLFLETYVVCECSLGPT